MRRGRFVLKQNTHSEWYFVLKAGNGEIIATSETYTTKAAAKKGINSVRMNAPFAKLVEGQRLVLMEDGHG